MGLYSLYHNLSNAHKMEWSIQSSLTNFLAEGFNYLESKQIKIDQQMFNVLCDNFHDKLASIDSVKFPRFGPCLVALDKIISVLCNDNTIG